MIEKPLCLTLLAFVLSSGLCVAQARSEKEPRQGSLIAVSQGTAGDFEVGEKIDPEKTVPLSSNSFQSGDDIFLLRTDEQGMIKQISTSDQRAFTERLIRPKLSTAEDVLTAYGRPHRIKFKTGVVLFSYEETEHALEFTIDWVGKVERESYKSFLAAPVGSLTIEAKELSLGGEG